ncbi:MAG: D-cysteine desulfhydrase [Bacillus sp. (in: Bacteria)]|nr:D-cysteine desulfhydrase [Bacillus sp. (in: firmicutes)]
MNLTNFPRRQYTYGATPIEAAPNLSKAISEAGPNVFFKRDDLLGLAQGGNKTRKLEFLLGDALAKGADTIITAGGIQSNHCRLTLAACVKEKLKCILVLEENARDLYYTKTSGNYLLYQLLGAENIKVIPNGADVYEEMAKQAQELEAQGRKPYVIPVGGSNVTGITGYAACAQEIIQQEKQLGVKFDHVVCVSGSGGMHAGLVAGLQGVGSSAKVIGINVSRGKEEQEEKVFELVNEAAAHLQLNEDVQRESILCFDEYVGPGYALPTDEMVGAVKLTGATEGLILDPVYTGKAMAGVVDLIRNGGYFQSSNNILFIHSGGSPAVYAYAPLFSEK